MDDREAMEMHEILSSFEQEGWSVCGPNADGFLVMIPERYWIPGEKTGYTVGKTLAEAVAWMRGASIAMEFFKRDGGGGE